MVLHMQELRRVGEQYARLAPAQAKGFMFEHILAAKFNADAASKGLAVRVEVTASNGDPHAAADLLITEGGKVLQRVQAKASDSSTALARYLNDDKYAGMTKVVPTERADRVRDITAGLAERHAQRGKPSAAGHADTARNVRGEITARGARSGKTTHDESVAAARHPQAYAAGMELEQLGREAAVAGAAAGAAGALLGGVLSGARNALAVVHGEKAVGEAALNTALNAGTAGMKAGLAGAGGAGIRHAAGRVGLVGLTKANVATATATAVIEMGATLLAYAKGEISSEEATVRLGDTSCSTAGGVTAGAVGGVLLGPVGAVVGSVIGYIVVSHVYQATLAVRNNAQLAKQEAARLEALSREACRLLKAARARFESRIEANLKFRRQKFSSAFQAIDAGLSRDDLERTLGGLGQLAEVLGNRLKFDSQTEFDTFMAADAPLVL
jgi:hypothetical protein